MLRSLALGLVWLVGAASAGLLCGCSESRGPEEAPGSRTSAYQKTRCLDTNICDKWGNPSGDPKASCGQDCLLTANEDAGGEGEEALGSEPSADEDAPREDAGDDGSSDDRWLDVDAWSVSDDRGSEDDA